MQGHKVRFMPGHTFRMSLPIATPHNADFDGRDEFAAAVAHGTSRVRGATAAGQNAIGRRPTGPMVGIVQDALLGLHLLTQPDTLLDHAHICRLLGTVRNAAAAGAAAAAVGRTPTAPAAAPTAGSRLAPLDGKQLFSAIPPEGLSSKSAAHRRTRAAVDDRALPAVARDRELLYGVLRKKHVGWRPAASPTSCAASTGT